MVRVVALFLCLCATTLAFAQDSECDELKRILLSKSERDSAISSAFGELKERISQDSACAKNLLGRIYFEGAHVAQDAERAHAIFYELAKNGYPPAQFNLAYVLSAKKDSNPDAVLSLLQGIVVSYAPSTEYRYLALKARDFGREYLAKLPQEKAQALSDGFEMAVKSATTSAASEIRQRTIQRRKDEDDIMTLVFVGMTASVAASRLAQARAASHQTVIINSMKPQYYSVYPMGGNYLYMVPH